MGWLIVQISENQVPKNGLNTIFDEFYILIDCYEASPTAKCYNEYFSAYMVKHLTDADWYQLLIDLDQFSYECRMDFFGAPKVDFVRAAHKYYNNRLDERQFHFKKMQLYNYQNLANKDQIYRTGPFTAMMNR